MALNYDLLCKSCDQRMDLRCDLETAQWIRKKAPALVRTWLELYDSPNDVDVSIRLWKNGVLDSAWLCMHWFHALVIVDEYEVEVPESPSGGA